MGPEGVFGWAVAAGIGVLLAMTLITAVVSPPVTVDVLNYHGPRQIMWLQQGSLAHFLTVNDRQLMMPPLAEVIGLQFLALTGDDRWANLPQWFAYAILPVAVFACVRRQGGDGAQGWLAAGLAACLPMAYLEASNGKNDLQGALWLTLILHEVIKARRQTGPVIRWDAIHAGVLVGLALLTKSTAFIFAPPLVLVAVAAWRRRTGASVTCRHAGIAAVVVLLVSGPFFEKKFYWYGNPLGEHRAEDGGHQMNEMFTPAVVASNALRNATLHMAAPWPGWNQWLEEKVSRAHAVLNLPESDRRTTCWGSEFSVHYAPGSETTAGAPWHFALTVVAVAVALLWRRAVEWRWLAWVCLGMAAGYCVLLKWQPWGARLQEQVFMAGIVLIAGLAGYAKAGARNWIMGVIMGAGLLAWWPGWQVTARPWFGPSSVFTVSREAAMYRYLGLLQQRDEGWVDILKEAGVRDVAIVSVHDLVYPLMRRLQKEMPGLHFHGAPASDGARNPDAILKLNLFRQAGLYHQMADGSRYRLVGASAGDGVYLPEGLVRAKGWEGRLPAFAGWTGHDGLMFRTDDVISGREVEIWREMTGEHAEVRFTAGAGIVRIKARLITDSPDVETLELALNGAAAERITLPPGSRRIGFELLLPAKAGDNKLVLRRSGDQRRPLKFIQLVIVEAADDAPTD
jgi:Dolichyl-phosphate-mannose-protein mannosyltransferase